MDQMETPNPNSLGSATQTEHPQPFPPLRMSSAQTSPLAMPSSLLRNWNSCPKTALNHPENSTAGLDPSSGAEERELLSGAAGFGPELHHSCVPAPLPKTILPVPHSQRKREKLPPKRLSRPCPSQSSKRKQQKSLGHFIISRGIVQ